MSTPFFSIIMPCYNDAAYLPKALAAIAAQSFRDFEICFVNDASTDNSEEVLFAFMREHPDIPVNYWKKEGKNQGASLSKNQGMSMATGRYILFNDADDWMDSDHLEIGYGLLKDDDVDMLIEGCWRHNEKGERYGRHTLSATPSRWVRGAFQGCFFKRSVIVDNGVSFKPDSYFDDFYLLCEINSHTSSFKALNEAHFNQLMRGSSFTHVDRKKKNFLPEKLGNTFRELTDVAPRLRSADDYAQYEYMCMIQYYSVIYVGVFASFRERREHYLQCREIMRRYYPDYLKNPRATLFRENGYNSGFKKKIWLSSRLEKLDRLFHTSFFMSCLLWVYQSAIRASLYKQR